MKRFLLIIVIMSALGYWGIFSLFHSVGFYQRAIPWAVGYFVKDVQVNELSIGDGHFDLPQNFSFENVRLNFVYQDKKYLITVGQFNFFAPYEIFTNGKESRVNIQALDLKSDDLQVEDLNLNMAGKVWRSVIKSLDGHLKIGSVTLHHYQLDNIDVPLKGARNIIRSDGWTARLYNGDLVGDIRLDLDKHMVYRARVKFDNVDLALMKQANPLITDNVNGQFSGFIAFGGFDEKIESVQAEFKAINGGQMKAALLSYLIPYIPKSTQRKDLEGLVARGGFIPFEVLYGRVESLAADQLKSQLDMKSAKFNLDFQLALDVNWDGRLNNLFKLFNYN